MKVGKRLSIVILISILVSNFTAFAETGSEIKSNEKPKFVTVEELVKDEAFQNRYIDIVHPSMSYYEWTKKDKEYMNRYLGKNLSEQEKSMLKQEMVDLQNKYYKYYNNYVETNNVFYFPRTQLEIAEAIGRGINARFNAVYDTVYYEINSTVEKDTYPQRGKGNLKDFHTDRSELTEKDIFHSEELDIDLRMIDKINNLPFNTNGMRNAKIFKDTPSISVETGRGGVASTSASVASGSTDIMLHELGHVFDSVYIDSYEEDYYKFRPNKDVSILQNGKSWSTLPMENFAEDFKYVMQPTKNSYSKSAGTGVWGSPNEKEKEDLRNYLIQKTDNDQNLYYARHYLNGDLVFFTVPYMTNSQTIDFVTEMPKGAKEIKVSRRKDSSDRRSSEEVEIINIDSPNVKVVDKGHYNEVSFTYTMENEGYYTFVNDQNPEKENRHGDWLAIFYDSALPDPQNKDIVYPKNQFANKKLAKPVMEHNVHNNEDFFVGHVREGEVLRKTIYTAGRSHVYTKRNTFFYEVTANDKVIYEENVVVGFTFDDWVHQSVNYFDRAYMVHSDLFGEKLKDADEIKVTFYGDKSRKEKLDEFKIKLVDPNGANVSGASENTNTAKPSQEPTGPSKANDKYIVSLNAVPITFNDDLGYPVSNKNGRTLIPIRVISEKMGYKVEWDKSEGKIEIIDSDTQIEFKVGENTALVNGEKVPADTKSEIIEGRTYIPLRFVSEAMGATVDWISHDGILFINIEKTI